jgi:signal transduction histidine kinase
LHISEQLQQNTRLLVPESDEWKAWPVAAQAKVRLGLTQAQLNQLIVTGRLIRWSCPDASLRFAEADVDELAEEVKAEQRTREQSQSNKEREQELSSILSRAVALLKISHDHIESMFKLVSDPIQRGTDFLLKVNDQQAKRIAHMEQQHEEMLQTREDLLSAAHERELKARKTEIAGANVRHAIDQISQALGPIAGQILNNMGLGGLAGKAHPGLELLQSIDPAMLNSLIQLGMLTPLQVKLCRQIWPDLDWPEPPPASTAAPVEQTPPAASSASSASAPEEGKAKASSSTSTRATPPPANDRAPRQRRTRKGEIRK